MINSGLVANIDADSKSDAFALKRWLDDVPRLRGRSQVVVLPVMPGKQGGVTEVLAVTLGSGGAVALLLSTLSKWLEIRGRSKPLKIVVTSRDRQLEVEIDQTAESADLIRQILEAFQDEDG